MAPRKRTASPVERLIVRLRDEERYALEKIGDHLGMEKVPLRRFMSVSRTLLFRKAVEGLGLPTKELFWFQDGQKTVPGIKEGSQAHRSRSIGHRRWSRNQSFNCATSSERKRALQKSRSAQAVCVQDAYGETQKDHLQETTEDWKSVLWTDESKFNLCNSDGIRYVRRSVNTRFDPHYTVGTVKHRGRNIMVWGCFSLTGIGPLHRINGIMNQVQYREILQEVMLPHARRNMLRGWVLQQDNDPKHTVKSVKRWVTEKKLRLMEWPVQSPDLNPIENLWEEVERRLAGQKFRKPDNLFNALSREWAALPLQTLETLVKSMPRGCKCHDRRCVPIMKYQASRTRRYRKLRHPAGRGSSRSITRQASSRRSLM
uniref:Tc1-like transposase DDE domain-containing protein n=1 Tax=Plectus sambesii TaxID=2011161 RepID=A0A914UYA6_9BILA